MCGFRRRKMVEQIWTIVKHFSFYREVSTFGSVSVDAHPVSCTVFKRNNLYKVVGFYLFVNFFFVRCRYEQISVDFRYCSERSAARRSVF